MKRFYPMMVKGWIPAIGIRVSSQRKADTLNVILSMITVITIGGLFLLY